MELLDRRRFFFEKYTTGDLLIDGAWFCRVCEDRMRDFGQKVPGETCIPVGRYRVEITMSVRFGCMMPLLLNVEGFAGIRIHPGNTAADTAGCLLVGMAQDAELEKGRIGQSKVTFGRLMAALIAAEKRGEEIFITIE